VSDRTAELRKLAHTLDLPVDRLAVVAALPAEDLRDLRRQAGDALFEAGRPAFARVAALSRAIPGAVAAKLTEAVLPPLIAARTAELLDPDRAADLVRRLSDRYLGEVALRIDAARAPEVIEAIPADRVGAVARELARRQEWVVIAGFVDQVSGPALRAAVAEFTGEQLLRIGFVLDEPDRLDEVAALLGDRQVDELLAAAPGRPDEFTHLVAHLSGPRSARLHARLAAAPASVRSALAGRLPAPPG
jgi:hypothetical protein